MAGAKYRGPASNDIVNQLRQAPGVAIGDQLVISPDGFPEFLPGALPAGAVTAPIPLTPGASIIATGASTIGDGPAPTTGLIHARVTLTDADLITMAASTTVGFPIVAAPGPGFFLAVAAPDIIGIQHIVTGYGGGDTDVMYLKCSGALFYARFPDTFSQGLQAAGNRMAAGGDVSVGFQPQTTIAAIENQPLYVALGAARTYTGGDPANTMILDFYYRIIAV